MSVKHTAAVVADPRNAIAHVANPRAGGGTHHVSAILWLSLALLGLWAIRNGRWPTWAESGTALAAVGAIVVVGQFTPRLAFWVLFALVVAAGLGAAPKLEALLAGIQTNGIPRPSLRGS